MTSTIYRQAYLSTVRLEDIAVVAALGALWTLALMPNSAEVVQGG
tara:strand:+ start:3771 stop:3905 length:135 start_codon:yes stop_codon:yes gene_type:complete